uniref:Uncharacterized protein n=1 Tax=Lepeophtheirus salmonis TaxID=72036 RepID=A0A0K2VEV7_LEPSM
MSIKRIHRKIFVINRLTKSALYEQKKVILGSLAKNKSNVTLCYLT